ncbi:MAG: hypothetical protein ACRCSK_05080 [Fusobacteriaceae bacterium]
MREFKVAYVPIGVPTFHMESAGEQFQKSVEMLKKINTNLIFPDKILLSIDDVRNFVKDLKVDLLIIQNTTFANSAYASEIVREQNCDIILWTLREPVIDGGRLRLNSLTGAYSAGNLLNQVGRKNFEYIFGTPTEEIVISRFKKIIKSSNMKLNLKYLNLASVGNTPQGFGFGKASDSELLKNFGINLVSIETRELMNKAKSYSTEEYKEVLVEAKQKMIGLEKLPEENVDAFARLYKAYKDFIDSNKIGAMASRCWPDYFVDFGTPVCGVLGLLNDNLIPSSCESDLYGAISMYVGTNFSNQPVFFGDPVSLDEKKNTITYWHCGTAACSLARKDTGPEMGVHPNRKIGPTMEFGCKPSKEVTVFRIGKNELGEFRFFILKGEALDEPKQFSGTSIVVKTKTDSLRAVEESVKDGWEPHFVVIYGDVSEELEILARFLKMEIKKY